MAFKIKVNGAEHGVHGDRDIPLLWVLRDALGLTGTKFGYGLMRGLHGASERRADALVAGLHLLAPVRGDKWCRPQSEVRTGSLADLGPSLGVVRFGEVSEP